MPPMDDWDTWEYDLFQSMSGGEPELEEDDRLKELFDDAFLDLSPSDERQEAIERLEDYLMNEYGIALDDVFDWEEWREGYETA